VSRGVPANPGAEASLGAPIEALVRLIRGRHKPDILIRLNRGRQRFGELRRAIPGVSERVLSRQLDELERDGLVDRTVYPEVPPRVEYSLTPFGSTLCPILKQMWKWGMEHVDRPSAEEEKSRAQG
jgi:DNA-binding HxlR family transcriptional regulator